MLMQPLKGTDYIVVDGEPSYNGTCDNLEPCTMHKRRRIADKDPQLQKLKEEDWEAFLKEYRAIHDRLKKEFYERLEKRMGKPPPEELPTSTNSIEGGNWRLKYALATLYWTCKGLRGRVLLLCLRDSLKTFSGRSRGEPDCSHGPLQLRTNHGNGLSGNSGENKQAEPLLKKLLKNRTILHHP